MSERTSYLPGTFSWVDLATTDAGLARGFYESLFGWKFENIPTPDGDYSIARYKNKKVAALYQMSEEKQKSGIPSHWLNYVSVEDVEETGKLWAEKGGIVIAPPFDVMDAGRMAVLQDPFGAIVAIWQPKAVFGAELVNEVNCFGWNELNTRQPDAAKDFYSSIFGWSFETGAEEYIVIRGQEGMNGGIFDINGKMPKEVPDHWATYFTVENIQHTVDLAKQSGGSTLTDIISIEVGRFAVVCDPTGGSFVAMELNGEPD